MARNLTKKEREDMVLKVYYELKKKYPTNKRYAKRYSELGGGKNEHK